MGTLFVAPALLNLQVRQRSLCVPHTVSLVSHHREVRFSSRTTAPLGSTQLSSSPYLIHSGKELVPPHVAIFGEQAPDGRDIKFKKQLQRARSVPPAIPWRSRVAPQLATHHLRRKTLKTETKRTHPLLAMHADVPLRMKDLHQMVASCNILNLQVSAALCRVESWHLLQWNTSL